MKPVYFISDLHLQAKTPEITQAFFNFLKNTASGAEALYLLGDVFEYWAGDDDAGADFNAQVIQALRALSQTGVAVYLMLGNRDFLIGAQFAQAAGVTLLEEPHLLTLDGQDFVLQHGDALCKDDVPYQQFRAMVRNPQWQAGFLAKPLAERKAIIEHLRQQSEMGKQNKDAAIMDVNFEAVEKCFKAYPSATLIHGHTHRPGKNLHDAGLGRICERWVLPDWHNKAVGLKFEHGALSFFE